MAWCPTEDPAVTPLPRSVSHEARHLEAPTAGGAPQPASGAPVRTGAPEAGLAVELLTVTEAARRVGISRQALTRRVKRGTLKAQQTVISGELVWRIPVAELARAYPSAPPGISGSSRGAPVRTPVAPVQAPLAPGPSADLVVMRSDYRAMLAQVREQTAKAEARERRARRALAPALWGLALCAVAVAIAWTGWSGASVRAGELASEVPDLRARAEFLAGEVVSAQLRAGEGVLALERSRLEAFEAQRVYDLDLAQERTRRLQVASELAVEREARQRVEASVLSPVLVRIARRVVWWGMGRRVF